MSSKYAEASKFITENMSLFSEKERPDGKGKTLVYKVNQAPYLKFMKSKGLDKATLGVVAEASEEYNNGAIEVLTEELLDHKDVHSVTIRTSAPTERIDLGVIRSSSHNNPKEKGSKITKYGRFFRNTHAKNFDQDLIEAKQRVIEKASK